MIYQRDNEDIYHKLQEGSYLNFWYTLIAFADILNNLFYNCIFYYLWKLYANYINDPLIDKYNFAHKCYIYAKNFKDSVKPPQ